MEQTLEMDQTLAMQQKEKIKEMMIDYLVNQEGIAKEVVANGATKVEDLGIDSLNIVEMLYEIEDKYGIRVDNLNSLKDMTLDALAEFLGSLAFNKAAA